MKANGRVFKYGDNVDTDVIIPARYLNSSDPAELATHCMEDIDKEFVNQVQKGDIIVAEKNFGCGSSREHAPIAIKAAGVSCVIAETFARIFYRNAINIGLPIIECPEASRGIDAGDEVEVVGPDVPAFAMAVPMMRDMDGFELSQPRRPQMEFRMRLPRPVPALSIVRACRPSS